MRLLNGILYDMKFQLRHGFYYAYAFISIIYIAVLRFLPQSISDDAVILIIFSDPSVLGAFFIGAVFILEKSQNTLEGIFITPIRIWEYIFSKVISLTIISMISSFTIAAVNTNKDLNILVLFFGVFLTSIFYTFLGFIIAVYSKNTNQYLIKSSVIGIFLIPIIEYLGILSSRLFYIFPGKASLILIEGAFRTIGLGSIIYSVILLLLWCFAAYFLLEKVFYKKIILRIGD